MLMQPSSAEIRIIAYPTQAAAGRFYIRASCFYIEAPGFYIRASA